MASRLVDCYQVGGACHRCIEEALTCENSKEWECAMQEEYDSLMVNNTWTLVPLLVGRKPVSCKWVFKIKQGANGEVERYKARLVVKGLLKHTKWITTKLLRPSQNSHLFVVFLHWRPWKTWEIYQMDVKTTFLNGERRRDLHGVTSRDCAPRRSTSCV
jgi:hypothetical protein